MLNALRERDLDRIGVQTAFGASADGASQDLIKGGYVASLDRSVGGLPVGDVLIDGATITAIGKAIQAPDAEVIDAGSKLVLPSLIDTHRHTWETVTRSLISEGDLAVDLKLFFSTLGPHYARKMCASATCWVPVGFDGSPVAQHQAS
jgi:cytosine/adenosine deaminase-related metal-dependent hydrolase